MKPKLLFLLIAFFLVNVLHAQTFTGTGGAIPDSGAVYGIYPLNVTGVGNINNNFGLATICVNIVHPWDSDLEIYIQSPDGTTVALSVQNGGSGDDYTSTCFSGMATSPIADAVAPFTGTFYPEDYLGSINNGQNANGVWKLIVKDVYSGYVGSLVDWSISFSNSLPHAPPVCNGNPPPGNTCAEATAICSFNGFCSSTSSFFTADSWTELDNTFCGTVQNNAFLKFVATGPDMIFSVWVTSTTNHDGIQMFFYDGGCGSGAITEYGCYSPIRPGSSPNVISANGLTAGNTYYLMIDGYAGDECDYVIEPYPPVNALAVTSAAPSVCAGGSVQLTATGGDGVYSWSGAGLNTYTGSQVIATPAVNTVYSVSSIDPGGICPITKQVKVEVISLPAAPTATGTLSYCQRTPSLPLTASGNNLLWYSTPTGGVGTSLPIIPSTQNAGLQTYYVSQTTTCESPRTAINVLIKAAPDLGPDQRDTICHAGTANLTGLFNTLDLLGSWSFNNQPIPVPQAVTTGGSYQLIVHNTEGCSDTGIVKLTVQPPFKVSITNDTLAIKGIPFQLNCTVASSYSWSPSSLLSFSDIRNPVITLSNDQQFIVEAKDIAGCIGRDTILIKVYNGNSYFVPNAFTPNGDGLNDVFHAIPVGIKHTQYFRVINRYGKTIFETNDPFRKGWDGTYFGIKQSPGTYVWFIKGIDKDGKTIEMKGTVILIL